MSTHRSKNVSAAAVLLCVAACGAQNNAEPTQRGDSTGTAASPSASSTSNAPDRSGQPSSTAANRGLCIDIGDLQMEPLDLEALDDEMPVVDTSDAVARALDAAKAHGTVFPLPAGGVAAPVVSCQKDACRAGIATFVGDQERPLIPLPGLDDLAASTTVEFVVALADINSDGHSDLWIDHQRRDPDRGLTRHGVVTLSLPALTVQWHGVVSEFAHKAEKPSCEGQLIPADADCDGDGDLVLVQRCGPARCLGDDSDPSCASGAVTTQTRVYLWSADSGTYQPNP